ncbi:MAG: rhodanese-like domain-containing protein [Burkholderiaceae bacterium]
MTDRMTPERLREALLDGDEIALLDVREEGTFSRGHLLLAACVPLSHLPLRIGRLVPRRDCRIVLVDAGDPADPLAARALACLTDLGYSQVSLLEGGLRAWQAGGHEVFSGVNVPSKAFGEVVEHWHDTPRLPASEVQAMQQRGESLVILDSRPFPEFQRMSIPGGVDCPGAELVYRVHMMAPDPDTTIIVNCAGRTRSIIGAQSLINAGLPNRIFALKDGTMGWELAGLGVARGESTHAPVPDAQALARAQARARDVARRYGVRTITADEMLAWYADPARTTMLLDVRTPEEFAAGHWPGARHAPGGQLVQATDEYVATRGARLVLADSADGVRATMTAHWLLQMGWPEVRVLTDAPPRPQAGLADEPLPAWPDGVTRLDVPALQARLAAGDPPVLIDLATSLAFRRAHVPGAFWAIRARLATCIEQLRARGHAARQLVVMAPNPALARLAAADLRALLPGATIGLLEGTLADWQAAGGAVASGLDDALTEPDDVWWKPYDHVGGVAQAMKDYLTWEVGLVEQLERDGMLRFRRHGARSEPSATT